MLNGKKKAVTLSFDDGVTQDIRFIEILNKYNLKGTFNLNFSLLGKDGALNINGMNINHNKVNPEDVKSVYCGHEIASHTLTHPFLTDMDEKEIVYQVETDRLRLSELASYEVKGFAYPGGGVNFNRRVADVIKNQTGIKYARTTKETSSFDMQSDLFVFEPNARPTKDSDRFFELTEKFLNSDSSSYSLFYVWGHTYEFDVDNSWDKFEEWCKLISGRSDIFYGTNREVFGID